MTTLDWWSGFMTGLVTTGVLTLTAWVRGHRWNPDECKKPTKEER